jgi:hypothetical protein
MKKEKKTIEQQINEFVQLWAAEDLMKLFEEFEPLHYLYDVTEEDDWVERAVGKEDRLNVRVVRTVYLLSRLSEIFAGKFMMTNANFPKLWRKLEEIKHEIYPM